MKLTGEALEQFIIWFELNHSQWYYEHPERQKRFIDLPDSMKWGVYLDFFDSQGIIITIECYDIECYDIDGEEKRWCYHVEGGDSYVHNQGFEIRKSAQKLALEKAEIILNSKQ